MRVCGAMRGQWHGGGAGRASDGVDCTGNGTVELGRRCGGGDGAVAHGRKRAGRCACARAAGDGGGAGAGGSGVKDGGGGAGMRRAAMSGRRAAVDGDGGGR
jgi:hypothetical protein